MKISDLASGLVLAVLGLGIAAYGRSLPTMPGQPFGAGLFPFAVGLGLVLGGAALAIRGRTRARAWPLAALPDWARDRTSVGAFLGVVAGVATVAALSPVLGTPLVLAAMLLAWSRLAGAGWRSALALAIVVPLVLQFVFSSLLRVPLPWGLLQPLVF